MRQMDSVSRYGGEEFLVILPDTAIDCATQVAERTRQDISQAVFRFDGKEFSLTVSIGVAQLVPNEHVPRMLERVDNALYAAKEAGRDRTCWHDGRAIHAALEESAVDQPREESASRSRPAATQENVAASLRPSPSLAPAPWTTVATPAYEALDAMEHQCDRPAFLWHVRQRIAEWKRGGNAFCVMLVEVQQHEHVAKAQLPEASEHAMHSTTRILHGAVREMDLIAHYGGACFSLLLPRSTLHEALLVARHACPGNDSSAPACHRSPEQFTLRFGVAEVAEGDDMVRLLQRAEAAVSAAPKNQICYHNGQWPEVAEFVAQPQVSDLPPEFVAAGAADAAS